MPFPQFYPPKGCYLSSLPAAKRYIFRLVKIVNKQNCQVGNTLHKLGWVHGKQPCTSFVEHESPCSHFHIHAHQCPYPRHHPPAHEVGAPTLWVVTLADTCRYDGTCHTISLADALGVSCEKRWLGSYLQYLGLYPMHHHYRHGHIRAVVSLQNSFFAEKVIVERK